MSDPSEQGGRPLASTYHQPEDTTPSPTSPLRRRRRKDSASSDERIDGTKSIASRRRPDSRKDASFGPNAGSSRGDSSTMQRSTSPNVMSPDMAAINYTRTGRISKAKKGLKVHNCECGRSYTRAEHLRRHQKNHASEALTCEFPDCGKTFYRLDLLQRHQERHSEVGKDSRRPSYNLDPSTSAEVSPQLVVSASIPQSLVPALSQPPVQYYNSSLAETTPDPRYTSVQFRTPRIPSSAFNFGQPLRSSPHSKSPFNNSKRTAYPVRQPPAAALLHIDGTQSGIAFEAYGSPASSTYGGSPIPGDYNNNLFANYPYPAGPSRTRTPSDSSFIEPWSYPSRSPTSPTSTMANTWSTAESKPTNLAYIPQHTSYPMPGVPMPAGVDPMTGYTSFGPKSMAQRDDEEQIYLFPESSSFGMDQHADSSPDAQYLDNYWRLFHPSFPVVHRATFHGINQSPMIRAAMIAIGAQYSNDPCAKRKSRILHDRCLKMLSKRDLDVMTEPERLCDYQSLFLVEVLSQYRARRAAKTLSTRFESLYHKFHENFRGVLANMIEITSSHVLLDDSYEAWAQWIDLASQHRLLQCCYVLEYQQATLLARDSRPSMIWSCGFDLPFPVHSDLWDAISPAEWATAIRSNAHMPLYIGEVTPTFGVGLFDTFQSSVLIAAYYNHFNDPESYLSPPTEPIIDHVLDASMLTKHQLLTAKLTRRTPVRSLLAVSGESWILSEKVPSPPAFAQHKTILKTWVNGLWSSARDSHNEAVKEALKLAIEILQQALNAPPETLRLELGADMGLHYAALVIWAVTIVAHSRINAPQSRAQAMRQQTPSPLPYDTRNPGRLPATPTQLSATASRTSQSPNPYHPSTIGLLPPSQSSPAAVVQSMLQSDITATAEEFLSNAMLELEVLGLVPQWPRDVVQWQQGCAALVRWVKMQLRNGAVNDTDSIAGAGPTSGNTGHGGDGHGELLDGVISVLEKVVSRGWEGWGV